MGRSWIIEPIFVLYHAFTVKVDSTITCWTSLGVGVFVSNSLARTVKGLPELCLIVNHGKPRLLVDASVTIFFELIFDTKELLMLGLVSRVSSIHQMLLSWLTQLWLISESGSTCPLSWTDHIKGHLSLGAHQSIVLMVLVLIESSDLV